MELKKHIELCSKLMVEQIRIINMVEVYGEKRYPLLIQNWELVAKYGFALEAFINNINTAHQSPYQPVAVLRNA